MVAQNPELKEQETVEQAAEAPMDLFPFVFLLVSRLGGQVAFKKDALMSVSQKDRIITTLSEDGQAILIKTVRHIKPGVIQAPVKKIITPG